ncbi:hypothetical protein BU23DRAFT_194498 [Bimuria novae-zelandiae CBS 107.79]|uniref:Uncharacterized protein n=1 Tax=Bimuria novae-zelandiae CBS 107.79 TaxID=1447943 RepID=A0A6A5V1J3_9PLEO|nr:hypothetical protein BU23DRAFT_194498 [Bimuria novae-zelandiae CBS 107.79]
MTLVGNYVDLKALEHGEIRDLKDIGEGRTKRRKRRTLVPMTGIHRVRVQKQKLGGTSAETLLFAPASDPDNAGGWPRVISNSTLLEEPTPVQAQPTRRMEVYSNAIPPSELEIGHQSPSPTDPHPSTPAQIALGSAENDGVTEATQSFEPTSPTDSGNSDIRVDGGMGFQREANCTSSLIWLRIQLLTIKQLTPYAT